TPVPPPAHARRPSARAAAMLAPVESALARLGDLSGRNLDRRALNVNAHRIGKLEPDFGVPRRVRAFVVLVVVTLLVAAAIAGVLVVVVEAIAALANHMISKSAGG